MMRKRLRPMPAKAELDKLYAKPHDHTEWDDHRYRVDVTSAMAHNFLAPGGTVADLSCGDGIIARRLEESHKAHLILGDYAPGYAIQGPIEETIRQVEPGSVNLWICSETIEHLDDPDAVLLAIRTKTDRLILSTPDGEDDDHNPEHIWGWDSEAVEKMLRGTGFVPQVHTVVDLRPAGCEYAFQIWACR